MASTRGGFLIGVGVMVLLASSGGLYAVQVFYEPTYREVVSYRAPIQGFYELTHSPIMGEVSGGYSELVKLIPLLDQAVDSYRDIVGFIPQLDSMVDSYRELAAFTPELEGMAENYGKAYSVIIEHKGDVEWFCSFVHSREYGDGLSAMKQLSPYANQIGDALNNPLISWIGLGWLGGSLKSIPTIIIIMEEARDWSGVAMDAMDALEMFPPERVEGYVSQMKWAVEAFPPEKAEAYLSQAMELVKAFPPDKAEAYLSLVKKAVEALPPSRVDDYLAQAKTASERAVEAVETLEAYPPSKVSTLLTIGAAAGVSLMGGGFALIFRAGRSQPSSGGETRVLKVNVAPPPGSLRRTPLGAV